MKLVCLPHSVRRPKLRSHLALAAALLVAVAMVGGFFSHAPVAHASAAHTAGNCGAYNIVNNQTGYYLDVDGEQQGGGWPIDQWYQDGSASEAWNMIQVPDSSDTYYLQNVNSGKYLDVAGASTANKASVIQWYYNGNYNQVWGFEMAPDGAGYNIFSLNSGLVLDVATSDAGAQVIQDSYQNWLSQEWHLECA